jgi:hypothetical protein
MNFDTAVNNALTQIKQTPQYRRGMWSFNDWLMSNYEMQVELLVQHTPPMDCMEEDRKWKVVTLNDEGLATMFKLKYG